MVQFYIDSADRAIVGEMLATGLFAGVTTNPSILDRSGLGTDDVPDFVAWAEEAGAARIFVQTSGSTADALTDRGEHLRALSDRVVVKVPFSPDGLVAARRLSVGGDVLVTALHSDVQALAVAATNASFLAFFVSRIDATGRSGIDETIAAHRALEATGARTQVMAGSLRHPSQILELARAGVGLVTIGPPVWNAFFDDADTKRSVAVFEELAGRGAPVAAPQ